ncbi:hypothetical protein Hbl1158_03000 [Halobaculum sp. CBA1158]|uniref:hypothetical protein n=1 Tax=Halobaculum sp. CBA1158 TaxID=2904243 RepID=UPI001F2EFA99|nr:hypothetical protein [Halobaculum sp. CBA1158]UIP00353.1 hypothetical protein Hbl1158_03000 [Halobaculum sp. CBA1158]
MTDGVDAEEVGSAVPGTDGAVIAHPDLGVRKPGTWLRAVFGPLGGPVRFVRHTVGDCGSRPSE